MDEWLAQVYGTGSGSEDLEKTAQAVLLEKMAEEEGVSLDGLSEEQLEAIAQEVLQGQGGGGEDGGDQQVKEAEAKFEEADFLGRVMAHSYTQELEKIAGIKEMYQGAKASLSGVGRRYWELLKGGRTLKKRVGGKLVAESTNRPGNVPWRTLRRSKMTEKGRELGMGAESASNFARATKAEALKSLGARAGTAAAVGGAGYGAYKALKKQASAFDTLAEQRALEILAENGIEPGGQYEEKTASEEQFTNALDQRAYELLQENGYIE